MTFKTLDEGNNEKEKVKEKEEGVKGTRDINITLPGKPEPSTPIISTIF